MEQSTMYTSIYHEFKSLGIDITQNKYFKWYCSLVSKRLSEPSQEEYVEKHHYVPDCMGGTELVTLSAQEHFLAHMMLTRFLHGTPKHQMINALAWMMKHKNVVYSKTYESAKKMFIENNRGDKNPTCTGKYHTPWGSYTFLGDAVEKAPGNTTKNTIIDYCVNNHTIITGQMVAQSNVLNRDNVGMSLRELGFAYEAKDGTCAASMNGGARCTCNVRGERSYTKTHPYHLNRGDYINSSGMNNSNWRGRYFLEVERFDTAKELSEYTGLSRSFISTLFKSDLDDTISERQAHSNIYLKSLDFDPVGMTWRELGFSFVKKEPS